MTIIVRPSPNFDARPPDVAVDLLLLHYTGMKTGEEALARLCDPAAKVSAHYLIEEDGRVFHMVDESHRAWHAGVAHWAGATNINARSIGIEIVNPGHEWGPRPYTAPQMTALMSLARDICARHAIPVHRVVGHSDVAPARKQDPGEWFPWDALARVGLGLWPDDDFAFDAAQTPSLALGDRGALVFDLQSALGAIGYGVEGNGLYDPSLAIIVAAFQRHFRPTRIDGLADSETLALVFHLAKKLSNTYLA